MHFPTADTRRQRTRLSRRDYLKEVRRSKSSIHSSPDVRDRCGILSLELNIIVRNTYV